MLFGFFRKKKEDEKEGQTDEVNHKPSTPLNRPSSEIKRASIAPKRRTVVVKRRGGAKTQQQAKKVKRSDFFMKLILCGDGAVGKTALRERYLGRGFSQSYLQTIGADFATTDKELNIDGNMKSVQYQIWDLAGQSEFQAVRGSYYEGCFGSLMVYDCTRRDSFHNIQNWITELWENSGKGAVPIVLLGNKVDLKDQFPEHVKDDEVFSFIETLNEKCRPHNFEVSYLETSALTGKNVEQAFLTLGENVVKWIISKR
ncbi:MAG: Rab family GTPase [Candidatus Hodarchaeales archaeon]|jgi:Ras-related protein Rab-11A